MSTDPRATQAKADGSAAWSIGNYEAAIEHFSTAISFGGDKEFLKLLYSNRSAAYLKIKKNDEALKDANKCVEIDSNWGKGYGRKGDVLIAMRKYTEAYNAYNYGLRVAPGDSTLTEKCEQAMKYMRHEADHQQRQSSNSGFGSSSSNASASVPVTGWVYYAKMATLALCVLYLLPLGRFINSTSYKLAAALFSTTSIFALYKAYGFPKFNSEYGMKIIPDPSTMRVFMGLFLIMAKPYILPIAGLFLNELTSVTPLVLQYIKANLPAMQAQIQPMLSQYMPSMAGQDLSAIVNSVSPSQFNSQLLKLSANCEVLQGVFLIVELLLPTRNVIQLYLWWQYLQMRYMLDQTGNIKFAFTSLDKQLTGLLSHRLCPQIVRTVYGYIKVYMAKQVTPPTTDGSGATPGGGGLMGGLTSAMSKCTIM